MLENVTQEREWIGSFKRRPATPVRVVLRKNGPSKPIEQVDRRAVAFLIQAGGMVAKGLVKHHCGHGEAVLGDGAQESGGRSTLKPEQ